MNQTTLLDVAGIAVLIFTIVQLFVLPYVPASWPRQNDIVRGASTVLGAILVPLFTFSAPGAVLTQAALLTAIAQGVTLGAGLTYGVKAAKLATSPDTTVLATGTIAALAPATPDPAPTAAPSMPAPAAPEPTA